MKEIDSRILESYRGRTYRSTGAAPMSDVMEARTFVKQRGFVFFWPIKGVLLPSLWVAVAGDRPVANAHDDPGHVTWGWKDQALDQRWWYYAKVLRGKATLIALDIAPFFYALSENFGEPASDYLDQYQDGLLSHEAKLIYEALLEEGPIDTVNLRRKIRMTSKASNSPFDRALTLLQRDFKILPVGVAQTGAWRYSFRYECVHRWYPTLPEQARSITRRQARAKLMLHYLRSVGAAGEAEVRKVFQWPRPDLTTALQDLVEEGEVMGDRCCDEKGKPLFVVDELLRMV